MTDGAREECAGSGRRQSRCGTVLVALVLATMVSGCASRTPSLPSQAIPPRPSATIPPVPATPGVSLVASSFDRIEDWQPDGAGEALQAFRSSCAAFASRNPGQPGGRRASFGTPGEWQRACAAARQVAPGDFAAQRFFEENFAPYLVGDGGSDQGLFTGYYEPILRGSWQPTARYRYPIYRTPPEAAAGRQVASRAGIERGALAGRGLEILWVDDPIDVFFLHIQGSGRAQMTDGIVVRLGYHGKNGHSYFPIGRELKRRGAIPEDQISMQSIRAWLQANPGEADDLMNLNPSYVFFRVLTGDGPIGAQGVALTSGRSIAVDPAYVPYGVPVWIDTTDPLDPSRPFRRLMVAQDTGGAIKGAIRGDVFFGAGEAAGESAGLMKQRGRWYLLLPRSSAIPTS